MEKRIHEYIPYIKDLYTITSSGQIYSDKTGLMKTRSKKNTEYQLINLMTVDNKKKTLRLHRLVLMAFSPNEEQEELQVNHIDGNKMNNSLENLEWCNASENQKHAYKTGLSHPRRGGQSNFSKLTESDIELIFKLREEGYLQREIAKVVGCTNSNISCVLKKKTWQV